MVDFPLSLEKHVVGFGKLVHLSCSTVLSIIEFPALFDKEAFNAARQFDQIRSAARAEDALEARE